MSYNYNPSSKKAEEFINHEEILETLSYAEKNKNNVELIDQILAKARLRKGLSHREAAVLLDCEIPEKDFPTGKHPFFSPVRSKRRIRKSTGWRNRSKRISTETGSSCLRRCICRITA